MFGKPNQTLTTLVEADLELFCNCWSAGFLGERLYEGLKGLALALAA